ncbi:hypothetical protein DM02DRAFT_172992 [Periconia macrospinosa]|uniref:Uncharacterized protein n=1 Tax=Periconia macrospinosa TaxID=97972 RepID=A0A2V1DA38_9PLEO|nr:hypothetical protein DM02DRAFT_172992 [Periconia macrospinosa]
MLLVVVTSDTYVVFEKRRIYRVETFTRCVLKELESRSFAIAFPFSRYLPPSPVMIHVFNQKKTPPRYIICYTNKQPGHNISRTEGRKVGRALVCIHTYIHIHISYQETPPSPIFPHTHKKVPFLLNLDLQSHHHHHHHVLLATHSLTHSPSIY